MKEQGDYTAEMTSFSLGFWLPNLVNTLSVNSKKYSTYQTNTLYTEDELHRFSNRFQIHAKPEPYTIAIDMGYQTLSRSYNSSDKDTLRSIFLGFETALTVKPRLTIVFGAEMPIYSWGIESPGSTGHIWLFQAFAGFVWTFDEGKIAPVPLLNQTSPEVPVISTDEEDPAP
jgi:hypothetical protein